MTPFPEAPTMAETQQKVPPFKHLVIKNNWFFRPTFAKQNPANFPHAVICCYTP